VKAAVLRNMTLDELASKLIELKEENMRIRCNTVLQTDSDVHQMKKTRRDIARVKTVIHEKNRAAQTENV
jgi:large subunit ribosomal protein L29